MSRTKALTGLKITDADKGLVTAVFATFGVKDHDGDVTLPGAYVDGAEVRMSAWNHGSWQDALPVGKAVIRQDDEKAWFEGEYFLKTQAGREHFEVAKGLAELQEYSYGYDILEAEPGVHEGESVQFLKRMKVHEVSQVLLGAGIGTRTLAVKGRDMKFSDHAESVVTDVDALIERAAEVKAMRLAKGKDMGEQSQGLLTSLDASLKRLSEVMASEPPSDNTQVDMDAELLRAEVHRAQGAIA